ncbi:MAG: proline--tRNA ligase [Acidimicrobiia bacterium]|nr:MAG: proline--tRNA ligase [Acidimicrobiia bacterium]
MRWSQAHIPTLRDDPSEAEAASHRLLIRAGYMRQLMAGHYSLLPAAMRIREKIMRIIREEMNAIGGQEFLLPTMHPAEVWQASGRLDYMGDEMFRLVDRKGSEVVLGMTHEEIFTTVATELVSYKRLPQTWYQFQTKFRDEPRPKSGLLRVREFTMKDSYSFDLDESGLDASFDRHHDAYARIFERMGLEAIPVDASVGAMGGTGSIEFMVRSDAGEDWIATCSCGYAANLERATSTLPAIEDPAEVPGTEPFPTPGVRTIADLVELTGLPADRQVKTLVYIADDAPVLVLLRGDHDLMEQKLIDGIGTGQVRPAHEEEIVELLGAHPGSLGAVGVAGQRIIADPALQGRRDLMTGANEDDVHLRNVDVDRDIAVSEWMDLRSVAAGEPCIECGAPISLDKTIELGHIFKLGRMYTESLGVTVLDEDGKARVPIMGSYGIGVERALATAAEVYHDEHGLAWPMALAPWEVVITVIRPDDALAGGESERIYAELTEAGIDVILDDRAERPGVKFADAELVGIPVRLTVGPRGLADGIVELAERATGEKRDVAVADVVREVVDLVHSQR